MGDSCASIRVICCRRPHRRRSCNSVITTALAAGMHRRGRNLLTARPAPSPRGVSARPSAPLSSRPSVSFAGCAAPARPGGQTNAIIRHGARWEPHAGYAGPSADSPGKGPGVASACPGLPRPLHNGGDDHFSAARPAPLDSRSEEAMTVMTSWGHQPHQLARTAPVARRGARDLPVPFRSHGDRVHFAVQPEGRLKVRLGRAHSAAHRSP